MNLKNNLTRILAVLIVMIIAMTVYAVTALTNVTPEVTLTAVNYQGGEETSGFFEKDQNRAVFKNQYDKNSYYAYKSHNIMPRKITDINEKYKNSLFCLDNTLEFPQGNGIVYQNIGDLRTVKSVNTNQGEKNLTDEQKNKLFWLFENMYLREESKEVKESYKTELFKNTFIHTGGDANDSEKLELALRKYNVEVTEDDLAVIEQWAIWYIINGDDSFRLNGANMLLDSNKEIVPTTDKKQLRLNVYDYLKTNIDKNGNYKVKGNIPSNYSIFDQKALRYAKNDKNYSILKNIKFNLSNDLNIELKDVKINYLNKDNTLGKEISRSLMQVYLKSDESKEVKDSLKDVALKGEFGIKINEVMPENAHGLVITPIYDVKSINANVFIPKEENNKKVNQPIVNIERNKVTVNTPYGIPFKERESQKKYDLALRKSIVSIDGKIPEVSRLPRLDVSTDKNELLQNGKGTTITYKHPKNPLEVNIGSTVKYQIKVYNEETTEGIVTEIHDKLPSHLKLKENSELNKQYGWRQLENNVIATNYLNGKVLEGMKIGENHNIVIAQGYVEVELEVTDKATNDEILTNIASIAGQKPNSDRDSNPGNVKYPNDLPGYKGNEENKNDLSDKEYFYKGQEDDDDFEKVIVKVKENPVPEKKYDLALRKSIVSIDGKEPEVSRLPKVDTTKLKNDINQAGENTTAEYKHPKNPLKVKVGSMVKYRITVFNEETTEGIATEIHDKLPNHLKLKENSELNKQYGWRQLENNVIATNYLNEQKIAGQKENNILDSKYVEVELEITDKATNGEVLTNIASIAGQNPSKDRDSNPGNVKYPNDLPGYKGNPGNKNDLNDREYFYKGQEDDDDFEKVIVETPEKPKPEPKNFDLSLRKFINEINGKAPEVSREPKVDVTPLINRTATTAIYNHSKEPITVKSGDKVIYTLRVYNEGDILAKVSEISDYIPAGLDFLPDDEINVKYGWKLEGNKAITKYLENTELKAFDSNSNSNNASLDYKDVKIALVVNDKKEEKDSLKNIGEIQNHIPKESKDRDSNPGNVKTKEYGTKNQEDDDDYEPLKKQEEVFDFTLKKFITHIESKDGKKKEDHSNRAPVVNVTPLKTGGTTAEYNHSKEPLLVLPEDRVVYTLRVYNEGNIDGYAEKIVDNVPSNLEFIESDPINVKYRWKKTENGLETDYLSRKASSERKEDSKIAAFNSNKDTLAYKDVQVAFRISKNYKPADGIIKNIAEITEDWNEKGIPDRDSKPNNKNPKEDDEDYDQLKPAYFDLSLRKIVSKIFVIENGKTKTVNTNHKYSDSPEGVAKIELDRKKINKTEVKWEYKIRVTNEGVIPGYAKEVTDYIPEGTYFDPKDNTKDWYKKGEKAIATKSLANRLLKPGESAELTVYLRWKKDPKNMGVKTNWAEISEDGNEYGIPDRDSVPGNKRPHEDDIDDAPVALAIATGLAKSYIMYVLAGVTTLAVIVAISKGYMVYKMKNKNAKINKK